MAAFNIRIAGHVISVHSLFESTRDYCRDYLTQESSPLTVTVTRELLAQEQCWLDAEAGREGLRRRVFGDPFLERNYLQRAVARLLLPKGVILIHGSGVALDGRGYLFTAPCGTGKSTHARLWRQALGASAVNDDKPFLQPTGDGALLCGSPWTGKHGIGENICVPLQGICLLARGSVNTICPLPAPEAMTALLPHCALPDTPAEAQLLADHLRRLTDSVPLWQMQCTPTVDAAHMAHSAMGT